MIERIAILGTGLLGTSIGLALRAAGFRGSIAGWNRGAEGAQLALEAGAIDSIAGDPLQAARESQVVLLAVPIYATLDYMEKLAGVLGSEHLITDVGSTKGAITEAAGRLFNTPERAALGSKCIDLDPARHDELVAWVSHLPQFLATALSALLQAEVGDAPELKDVGGRALREMTRLGASPYTMWRDIASTNTEAIQAALHALEQRLAHLRENLRTPELRDEFEQANRFRRE